MSDFDLSIIGFLIAAWGFGFCTGLVHLSFKKLTESI